MNRRQLFQAALSLVAAPEVSSAPKLDVNSSYPAAMLYDSGVRYFDTDMASEYLSPDLLKLFANAGYGKRTCWRMYE